MDVETLLTTTRSVRRKLDLDRPVEPKVITDCLRIAMQAPIASALVPSLRWLVIRDPEVRAEVAAPVRQAGYESQAKYGHLADEKSLASGRHLLDVLDRVPVFVVLCLRGRPGTDPAFANAFYGSAYPALWSFQLALRSRGLGSTFVGYHLADREREVAELLGIPEDVTQITLLPVAYTTTTGFRPAARPPVDEITYYDRWDR
jgi:nitroreductase